MRRRDFVRAAAGAALPLARAARARGPRAAGAARPGGSEPPVATLALHYMTWLQQRSWPLASTWPVLRNPAYPLPRGYDSDDPVVFRAHNRDGGAARLRVAVVVVGAGERPRGRPHPAALPRPRPRATVPLLVLYEATEILDRRPRRLLRLRRPGQLPALRGRRRLPRPGLLVEPPLRAPLPPGGRAPGALRLGEPQLHGRVAGGGGGGAAAGELLPRRLGVPARPAARRPPPRARRPRRGAGCPSTRSPATGSTTPATCRPRGGSTPPTRRATSRRSAGGPSS